MGGCCCFTGHRELSGEERTLIRVRLDKILPQLVEMGYDTFAAGGALGFDTMAARAVLRLKESTPVRLHLILPCRDQDARWPMLDRAIYADILSQADEITYAAEQYHRGCMYQRNRMLVDSSTACVCFLTRGGGTAYTVDYAKKKGLRVFNLAKKS